METRIGDLPAAAHAPMTKGAWTGPTQQEYREYRNPEIARLFSQKMLALLSHNEDTLLVAGQAASRLAHAAGLQGGLGELIVLLEVQGRAAQKKRKDLDDSVPPHLMIVNLMENTWCTNANRADLIMATGLSKQAWDQAIGQWS